MKLFRVVAVILGIYAFIEIADCLALLLMHFRLLANPYPALSFAEFDGLLKHQPIPIPGLPVFRLAAAGLRRGPVPPAPVGLVDNRTGLCDDHPVGAFLDAPHRVRDAAGCSDSFPAVAGAVWEPVDLAGRVGHAPRPKRNNGGGFAS
jgi:hypothetical protein